MEICIHSPKDEKRILIVGAGRSGMFVARFLSTTPNHLITVVETKSEIGGLWAYQELNEYHPKAQEAKKFDNFYKLYNCFQGSVYPSVLTNSSKDFFRYKDFSIDDFNPDASEFFTIKEYNSYLNAYWDHFKLRQYVTFNTLVKSIRSYEKLSEEQKAKLEDITPRTFVVTTADANSENFDQNEKVSTYDYVVVSSGQHSKPFIPATNGISKFKGFVLHSKNFREPDDPVYQDKVILLLGGGLTGIDMIVQFFHNPVKGRQNIKKLIYCSNNVSWLKSTTDFRDLLEDGSLLIKKG